MKANEIDIIFEKNFHELSEAEKLDNKDLFSNEEEFMQLKFVFSSMNMSQAIQEKETVLAPQIKENLDHLFHQTYQNKGILWYNSVGTFFISKEKQWHQQNLVRIAAVLLVVLLAVPLWNTKLSQTEKLQMSQLEKPTAPEKEETKTESTTPPLETTVGGTVPVIVNIPSDNLMMDEPSDKLAEMPAKDMLFDEKTTEASSQDFSSSAGVTSSAFTNHPDGVYKGKEDLDVSTSSNFALKNHADLLDVLTATY